MARDYTPEQITHILTQEFAASLVLTTLGFILYGVNLTQFANYIWMFRKRDHHLTRIWASLIMLFNTAATVYQVYSDWTLSIIGFTVGNGKIPSAVSGNGVVLYSVVVFLVQLFWLTCIKKLLSSSSKLSWSIIVPIGIVSLAAFSASIAVGAFSVTEGPFEGDWPLEKTATALRITLACDVGADVAILLVLLWQLTVIKRSSSHLKKTASWLNYILCGSTLFSTLVIIAEIIFQYPHQDGSIYTGVSGVTISFSPLIPTIYCFSFLSILNARTNLLSNEGGFRSRADIEGLIPGMDFTVDMPSKIDCVSRDIPLTTSVVRSSEIKGLGNLDSPPDISEEKLQQEHQGSKQEIGIEDQA